MSGPAYFVSHGGAKFPELIIVLQGEGVTIELRGETFINERTKITSSTFRSIPDVPVGMFELKLPEGPYSALAATANLCTAKLKMPTAFVAQNGAEIHVSTPIAVTGCKRSVAVVRHVVRGDNATVTVRVPSAGELEASGVGLSTARAKASAAGDVTVSLALSAGEQRFVGRHPGRRLEIVVKLMFTARGGGRLSTHVTVLMH
jgi:hypothetical protein